MIKHLCAFFRKKLRKGNGIWWALAYTYWEYRWQRIKNDEAKLLKWQNRE